MTASGVKKYVIRHVFAGHEKDVRAVRSLPASDNFVSVSKDMFAKLWSLNEGNIGVSIKQRFFNHTNAVYSVCITPPDELHRQGLIFTGGEDSLIFAYHPELPNEPLYMLEGHIDTVCALAAVDSECIVSSSWDTTARIWHLNETKYVLKGHLGAVRCVAYMPENKIILTGSDDKTIRSWRNDKTETVFKGHEDSVHTLIIVSDDEFLSGGEDGTIRRWELKNDSCVATYSGHTDITGIALLPNGKDFATCGKNQSIQIWENEAVVQTIYLPSNIVWSLCVLANGDIVAGTSDGVLYIFTKNSKNHASAEIQAAFATFSGEFSASHHVTAMKLNEIPDANILHSQGLYHDQLLIVRNGNSVEEHQWSETKGMWKRLGSVGELSETDDLQDKVLFKGKIWDVVVDIELGQGPRNLKLPFNFDQDLEMRAHEFLVDNELSHGHIPEVVKLMKNRGTWSLKEKSEMMTKEEVMLAQNLRHCIESKDFQAAKTMVSSLTPTSRLHIVEPLSAPLLRPAMFIAIDSCKPEFVRLLVELCGADVNKKYLDEGEKGISHVISSLEYAVIKGSDVMVKHLMQSGYNIKLDNIPWLVSRSLQHCHMKTAEFIVDSIEDVDAKDDDGNTSLMLSTSSVEMTLHLIKCRANVNILNNNGQNALFFACLNGDFDTAKCLISIANYDQNQQFKAYQLLSTTFCENNQRNEAVMALRDAGNLSPDNLGNATLATPFGTCVEATTLKEINELVENEDNLFLQFLLLVKKILGSGHPRMLKILQIDVDRCFSNSSFDDFLKRCTFYVELAQEMIPERMVTALQELDDKMDFYLAEILDIQPKPTILFQTVYDFVEMIFKSAKLAVESETKSVYLMLLFNSLMFFGLVDIKPTQWVDIKSIVFKIVKYPGLVCSDGKTLLMWAAANYVRMHAMVPWLITMILACKVDVDARDRHGNTALHHLYKAHGEVKDDDDEVDEAAKKYAEEFVECGIHYCISNSENRTVRQCLHRLQMEATIPINIMCIAARYMVKNGVSTEGSLPEFLIEFVQKHDVSSYKK